MASSSDEGEIVERDVGDLKATPLPNKLEETGVDRPDRQRERYSAPRSPAYGDARPRSSRRSRSPPRGHNKRPRDERDFGGGRAREDTRNFRVHYEDSDRDRESYRRSRISYDDIDRSPSRASNYSYDGRDVDRPRDRNQQRDRDLDRHPSQRSRDRTRSPAQSGRYDRDREDRRRREEVRFVRSGEPSSRSRYDDHDVRNRRNGYAGSARGQEPRDMRGSRGEREAAKPSQQAKPAETQAPGSSNDADLTFEEPVVIDEDAEIERRRKRRAELLAKSSSATPLLVNAVHAAAELSTASSPAHTTQGTPMRMDVDSVQSDGGSPSTGTPHAHGEHSPALDIMTETDLMNRHAMNNFEEDGPSAADYDPTDDMKEDGIRDELRNGPVRLHGEVIQEPTAQQEAVEQETREAKPKGDDDDDDDFDMFADDFDEEKYAAPKHSEANVVVEDKAGPSLGPPAGGILDGDDKDGYYKIRIGEVMSGRYQVQSMLGKGMFSGVARALDVTNKQLVAIKIMRNNDALRKGGYTEISILQKLNDADPEGRKHIVKFERSFDYKGHLCMAFENLSLNLREVLKKFGNNVGINLGATRAYAHQIFVGLAHMRKCSIVHADLKPDNILVNENRNVLKICDLGTAIDRSDAVSANNEITPYLVSRFYRAPEIILGMPYDYAIDMWSIGCTLFELYTGKILFTGDSNNQMLKAIMEIRGKFTPKLFKRGQLSSMHFDDLGNFISVERDKALGKTTVRTLAIIKPTRDLRTRLTAVSADMSEAESKELNHFIDLLEHCLALNPEKRIKPADALKHPFFTSRAVPARR